MSNAVILVIIIIAVVLAIVFFALIGVSVMMARKENEQKRTERFLDKNLEKIGDPQKVSQVEDLAKKYENSNE